MKDPDDHDSRMASATISHYAAQLEYEREVAKTNILLERLRRREAERAISQMRTSLDWCLRMMESARPPEDIQHIREAIDFSLSFNRFCYTTNQEAMVYEGIRDLVVKSIKEVFKNRKEPNDNS